MEGKMGMIGRSDRLPRLAYRTNTSALPVQCPSTSNSNADQESRKLDRTLRRCIPPSPVGLSNASPWHGKKEDAVEGKEPPTPSRPPILPQPPPLWKPTEYDQMADFFNASGAFDQFIKVSNCTRGDKVIAPALIPNGVGRPTSLELSFMRVRKYDRLHEPRTPQVVHRDCAVHEKTKLFSPAGFGPIILSD